jgi:hypothetical protein
MITWFTIKANNMAVNQATRKVVWSRRLLNELGFAQKEPTMIHIDSQGNITLIKNHVHHNKTKHIDIQHHYVRNVVVARKMLFVYYSIMNMWAYILTKCLLGPKHLLCVLRFSELENSRCD